MSPPTIPRQPRHRSGWPPNRTAATIILRSISSVSSELQTADSALSSGVTALQHAISLGVEGANGTMSQQDLAALANQVQSISQQMLGIANLDYNGKYIFAGTTKLSPAVCERGGIAYQGNDEVDQVEVEAGQTIAVNQPGSQLFFGGGSQCLSGAQRSGHRAAIQQQHQHRHRQRYQ